MRKLLLCLLSIASSALVAACVLPFHDRDERDERAPVGSLAKYTIVIHPDVPADKAAGILDAAASWSRTTSGHVTFDAVYESFDTSGKPPMGQIRVFLGPPDPTGQRNGSTEWWGTDERGRPGRSQVWLDETMNDKLSFLVAMHEFGHALGLMHAPPGTFSIMTAPCTNVGDEPSCYDRQTVCKIWDCDPTCPQ